LGQCHTRSHTYCLLISVETMNAGGNTTVWEDMWKCVYEEILDESGLQRLKGLDLHSNPKHTPSLTSTSLFFYYNWFSCNHDPKQELDTHNIVQITLYWR